MSVINLKSVRKRKTREARSKQADKNRIAHGRRKSDKMRREMIRNREQKSLDDHKLD